MAYDILQNFKYKMREYVINTYNFLEFKPKLKIIFDRFTQKEVYGLSNAANRLPELKDSVQ